MNSIAILSPAGEKVTRLWMTLVALMLKVEFWDPSRVASPNEIPDSCAASQRPRRYRAIEIMNLKGRGLSVVMTKQAFTSDHYEMTPVIPLELSEMMMDYLWDDKAALRRCSLVCRSWLPTSRIHLFSTILLAAMNAYDLSVLCAPHSTITPYTRYLWIEEYLDEGQLPWLNKLLPDILPLFSAVESLRISDVNWDTLTFETKDCLYTFSRSLKSLKLYDVEFDTLDEPLRLISFAPSLEYLLPGSITCSADGVSLTDFTAPPLKEIIFGMRDPEPALFDWFCGGQPATTVHSVTLYVLTPELIHSVSAHLRVLGPALENLTFEIFEWESEPEVSAILCKEIDLAQNPSLRSISFYGLFDYHSPAHDPGWIVDIISQITSPFIERVTIGVYLRDLESLTPLNLSAPDALLMGKNTVFSEQSTRLLFIISGLVAEGEAKTAIRKSLHHLDSHGRLEFDFVL